MNSKGQSDSVGAFVETVTEYCALVEDVGSLQSAAFARRVAALLAQLYQAAIILPDLGIGREDDSRDVLPAHQAEGVKESIAAAFGKSDVYWHLYSPYEVEAPVASSLGDDLAGIYRELKAGIAVYSRGASEDTAQAVWEWRFGFQHHWGRHAVNALRAIHSLIADSLLDD